MNSILPITNLMNYNREKAKKIAEKVIKRGDKEGRPFGDILQEELIKATKDTGK